MAKVLKRNLLRNKFCVKNWYHKLYSVYHVRFNSISKYRAIFCNFAIFFYFAEMPIWVPSGASTKHFLVSKSSSGQYATFDTQQCFVLAPEGTQITYFLLPIRDFFAILRFFHFAEMAISVPSGTITEHCLVPKSSSGQGATFGTKQCSVIVPEGTQITDFLLPVRDFLEFCDFLSFCGNGNLSTFRNEYKALLGVKIFVWSIRNFWHQAVLCIRCGRYSNYRFSTSNPRFLLTKIEKMWVFVIRPNLSILRKWRFLGK